MTPSDGDTLVPVAHTPTEFEARTKASVLEDAGIPAFVFSGEARWYGTVIPAFQPDGIPVWVRRADRDRARAVLARTIADSVDLDWDEVDVGEPEESEQILVRGPLWQRVVGIILFVLFVWIAVRLLVGN